MVHMASGDSFYITTPIFYVNDVPHIGHAYTEVAADVLARWHRQRGDDTWLLTGTDEHGQKILRTAVANDSTPQAWADRLVETAWKPLLDLIDISNDDFIRTTDARHETAVTKFLQKLYDDGHIYSGEYEGYYCVGCEEYKQLDDLIENKDGDYAGQLVCKIHSAADRAAQGDELLLPDERVRAAAARPVRPSRASSSRRACATRSSSS